MKLIGSRQEACVDPLLQSDVIRLELPATHRYLNVIGGCVRALLQRENALPDHAALAYNVELAIHEICTNIVEHAYAGISGRIEITFTLREKPRQLVVELYDNGRSFNLSDIAPPNLEQPQTSGYGLFLVHQLMDEVMYYPEPGNNRWRLAKYY